MNKKKYIAYLNKIYRDTQKSIEEDRKKYNIRSIRVSLRDNAEYLTKMYESQADLGD